MSVRFGLSGNRRRFTSVAAVLVLGVGLCVPLALALTAVADTAPPPGVPSTVSADALPTVQQNGVVWSEVTVGNTVYATGSFSQTWPAGTTNTSANDTPRSNLLAFDIRTGNLLPFNHTLNAQGLAVTASPDGTRVYVAGDFTTVDGTSRAHIAAFDTATGALDTSFAPSLGSTADALVATNSTVYVGGNFFTANGVSRTRLAAFAAANGALSATWVPTADDARVLAMVMAPDGSRLIIGGHFATINHVNVYGLGAVSAVDGSSEPFTANSRIQDYGTAAAILSLTADSTQVYASGYSYIAQGGSVEGNFEGTAALDADTGNINWVDDCHGDTYDTFSTGPVLYSVSHAHDCSAIGDYPDTNPRVWHHSMAETTTPSGVNVGPDDYGWDYNGVPDSTVLHWFPSYGIGTYTKQDQSAWAITGNNQYLALGGEFPTVNGKAQQGLVRFEVSSGAPNKVGPLAATTLTPKIVSVTPGTAHITWQSTWDYDNNSLVYNVYRDGGTTPVYTTTVPSSFWQLPSLGFNDSGLAPGSTHTYQVKVSDPFNNVTSSSSTSVVIASSPPSAYVQDVLTAGAIDYWRLGETSGTSAIDWAGYSGLAEAAGVTHGAGGAINGDSNAASTFDGASDGEAGTTAPITGPNTYTVEAWVNTTSTSGGKIIGFGNSQIGTDSGNYDRQIYMDNSGHLTYGVYNNGTFTVTTAGTYNDGQWHLVVGTLSSAGLVFYVDGKKVGANPGTTVGQPYTGYWRVGGDNLNGWPNQPTSNYLGGSIDEAAIYPSALSLGQVQQQYTDSGRTINVPTAPTDTYGKTVFNAAPDLYWRLDDASGPTAKDASINGDDGTYSGGVGYHAGSPVTGSGGTGVSLDGSSGLIVASQPVDDPEVYSEELWFKTTTTSGGKLIGFGNATSGLSSNYDRHVWMLDSGQLEFGVWTGQTNTVQSSASYNDGKWHYLVATQGAGGLNLYVDGASVGNNPDTQAQAYTGYWRIGGDVTWGGNSSNYFAGSIDEAAVYSTELTPTQVQAHFHASPASSGPSASFTANCTGLTCAFDATGSQDSTGTITSYAWAFGDSKTGTGVTTNHTYASGSTYSVSLTVTDNHNQTSTVTQSVPVTAPQPPTAAFTPTCTNLACHFDASASTDTSGTITSYAWTFGDGNTGTGVTTDHSYASGNTYTVSLTVTDNHNQTSTVSHPVTVSAATNPPPVAVFTANCTALTCTVDASGSHDDGSIASYNWAFGDTQVGTGKTASNTYAAAGDFTITLTVTDNLGATGTTHQVVSPRPPANPPAGAFASDAFNRTVASGLGTADVGGPWSANGSASVLSVTPGTANITMSKGGVTSGAYLGSISRTDSDTTVTLTTDKVGTGSGVYLSVLGRRISATTNYLGRVRLLGNNSVAISLLSDVAGTEKVLAGEQTLSGVTYTPGLRFKVRLQVTGTGPTTLRLKVWLATGTEPTAWQLTATDSTATLQVPGSVGLTGYLSGSATNPPVTMKASAFASAPTAPTAGAPTAAFTAHCSALNCTVDASASSDPSGTISSYKWEWADGVLTTGVTSSHTYAAGGTYRITLTVTDPSGLTSVTTQTVTVPA